MTYTLVGTGNMAYFLAQRLRDAGMMCLSVYGRNIEKVKEIAQIAGSKGWADVSEIKEEGDFCIVAVSDDALEEVSKGLTFANTVVVHTAGSRSIAILPSRHKGVLWCVYSIVKSQLPEHRNIPVVFEASTNEAKDRLVQIAAAVSDTVTELNYEQRQYLHLAAVIGNNFTNHLMAVCEALCKEKGLHFNTLLPILMQTFDRVKHQSPAALQTGPAKRGDTATMDRQIAQLQGHDDWQEIYKSISASIENWYRQEGS